MKKVLFVKPPDRFLENEFVFQQLGPHYLQSYLARFDIPSDMLVLYEPEDVRESRKSGGIEKLCLEHLRMLHMNDGKSNDASFSPEVFAGYDVISFSVMSPQAPDAYLLSELINKQFPHATTVIGGSHPRYYLPSVKSLPESIAFDFIVPYDGWNPMMKIAREEVKKGAKSQVLSDMHPQLSNMPAPSRPLELMSRYNFLIAGVPAFHTVTALGCPFTCYFCESGGEKLRRFSEQMVDWDLETMASAHKKLNHEKFGVMFFDDVGLMNPAQVERLAVLVKKHSYTTWRAFTHAFLVVRYKDDLLNSFYETGGRRIGMGLETGSQKSLNMINKRNGQFQPVEDHYEAVRIANSKGIAVDAFTMIYPWEDENDLRDTTKLIEFVVSNPVNGVDELGRQLKNHIDSSIMTPFQGTKFNEMIALGQLNGVRMKENMDPGLLFYKGNKGGSGWPYEQTVLPKERYAEVQRYRNSLRPSYR